VQIGLDLDRPRNRFGDSSFILWPLLFNPYQVLQVRPPGRRRPAFTGSPAAARAAGRGVFRLPPTGRPIPGSGM
jgi:hypothetical protein